MGEVSTIDFTRLSLTAVIRISLLSLLSQSYFMVRANKTRKRCGNGEEEGGGGMKCSCLTADKQ